MNTMNISKHREKPEFLTQTLSPVSSGIRSTLIILALFFVFFLPSHAQVKAPKMECHSYVVMDAGSGQVLFGQDENKQIYPASTAKLMNAIVCIENGDVNAKIKTTSDVIDHTTPGTYCLGLVSGVTFTFKDLLSLSLISSAADATDSLAVGVFGSKEACVKAMNAKCAELGLTHTSFDNPVGSDIGAGFNNTYSTAVEMAQITRYAMAVPLIRETVKKSHYETTSGQEIYANTTNQFLRGSISYDSDRYHIIGSKSGTTNAAGHVFIATATDKKGHEVICAYFGNVSKESTFVSIRKLFNYTFKQYDKGKLALTGKCDDIRATDMRELFDTYVSLNCYPIGKDGRFYPNKAITRNQLARLIKKIDAVPDSATIHEFASANKKGTVTCAKAASLIQDIFPAHLSTEAVDSILADCQGTENLSDEEKEAFAVFVKYGLLPDVSCKNAKQILTRKQALLLTDHLADYQIGYAARYPVSVSFLPAFTDKQNTTPVVLWNIKWQKYYDKIANQWQQEEKARLEAEQATSQEASTTAETSAEAEMTVPSDAATASEAAAETKTDAASKDSTTTKKDAAP